MGRPPAKKKMLASWAIDQDCDPISNSIFMEVIKLKWGS
jgi:hypothetical protein